jgi:hypothetical protein
MPIGFQFAPAGLAAILAKAAGQNDEQRRAIAQAFSQQQADRQYGLQIDQSSLAHQQADRNFDLQQAQLARQAEQDQFDNWLRAYDAQGRLSSLYDDNLAKLRDLNLRERRYTDSSDLQRQELAQRSKESDANLDLSRQRLDLDNQKLDQQRQSQQDKVGHWNDTIDLRLQLNDQNIAQRDRDSAARTQAAMNAIQSRADRDQVGMQLKQYAGSIQAAESQYKAATDAYRLYASGLSSGMITDDQGTIDARRQQLLSAIDNAKSAIDQAHNQYGQFIGGVAGSSSQGPIAPATQPSPATQPAPQGGPVSLQQASDGSFVDAAGNKYMRVQGGYKRVP